MVQYGNLTNNYSRISPMSCDVKHNVTTEEILYSVFMTLIMITSVVGNVFVVMAVVLSNTLKKRVTFYFIASLACSDFCFAIFQLPFRISTHLNGNRFCHALPACYVMIIFDAIGNVASILNLLLIALDRFVAIKYPFRHATLMNAKNSKRLILGVWIFSAFWSFIGIFRWDQKGKIYSIKKERLCANDNYYYYAFSSFGIYVTVLIFITCTYLTILHVALQQIEAIEANQVSVSMDASLLSANSCSGSPSLADKMNKRRKRKLHRELRATKSVAIVYLAYVICWLPLYVINIIILVDNTYFLPIRRNDPGMFLFLFYTFVEILPALNTMVNPMIYSFSNKQFRDAVKVLLSKTLGLKFPSFHDEFQHSMDISSCPTSPAISHASVRGRML